MAFVIQYSHSDLYVYMSDIVLCCYSEAGIELPSMSTGVYMSVDMVNLAPSQGQPIADSLHINLMSNKVQ